jgi:putative MATE family efflux protein
LSNVDTKIRTDYTEGSVIQSILKMGLPSMFGFLAQHIYAMADMFWVSRLPEAEAAVAAVTFFNNLLWMLFALNHLIGPGSVAIISRRYGEKAFEKTEKAIKETLFLKLFFGVLMGVAGWFYAPEMLHFLGARDDALRLAIDYGRILLVGLPIMYTTYSVFTALRGIANPAWAMALMIGSNALNAILDPFLIFGWAGLPALGVNGAAYASVASYTLTLTVGLILFRTNWTNIRLRLTGQARMSVESMTKIVRIGIPAFLGELSFSGSRLFLTPLVAAFGTEVVAAFGVGTQFFAFGIMVLVGLGLGLSALIGHNLGANKSDRAKRTADSSIMLGIGFMAALGLVSYFLADFYMSIFFDSPTTISHGASMLRIWAFGFPFFGAFIMMESIHMGVGLNVPPMIVNTIHGWLLQVLPALVITQYFDMAQTAIWWVLAFSGVISSTGFYFYYRRGRWMTFKV